MWRKNSRGKTFNQEESQGEMNSDGLTPPQPGPTYFVIGTKAAFLAYPC